jgi:hypothetical protein
VTVAAVIIRSRKSARTGSPEFAGHKARLTDEIRVETRRAAMLA